MLQPLPRPSVGAVSPPREGSAVAVVPAVASPPRFLSTTRAACRVTRRCVSTVAEGNSFNVVTLAGGGA